MPLERFYKLPPDRQQAILDAAQGELVAQGAAASLNQIIRAAGVSKGAMYYYFEDREDLCEAVVARGFERVLAGIGDHAAPTSPGEFWQTGEAALLRGMTVMSDDPELAVIARLVHSGGAGERARRFALATFEGFVTRFLALGIELGAIRTDVPRSLLAAALTPMVFGLDRWFLAELATSPREQVLEARAWAVRLCRDLAGPKAEWEGSS